MKKIVSIVMVIAVLTLTLSIVGCVPPTVPQEKYNKVVSDIKAAQKRIDTLEGKVEELTGKIDKAKKYVEFSAYWLGGPVWFEEPEAAAKYYAKFPEKLLKALDDPELSAMLEEMGKKWEEMEAKGIPVEEIMLAMREPGWRVNGYLAEKIAEALR